MQRILWAVESNWRGANSSPHNRCSRFSFGACLGKGETLAGSETVWRPDSFEIQSMYDR